MTTDPIVVLVPESSLRSNPLLYRTAVPADDCTFTLKDIAPGNYKLFAWNGVLSTAWMNSDFIKPFENASLPLKVGQGEMRLDSPIPIPN